MKCCLELFWGGGVPDLGVGGTDIVPVPVLGFALVLLLVVMGDGGQVSSSKLLRAAAAII